MIPIAPAVSTPPARALKSVWQSCCQWLAGHARPQGGGCRWPGAAKEAGHTPRCPATPSNLRASLSLNVSRCCFKHAVCQPLVLTRSARRLSALCSAKVSGWIGCSMCRASKPPRRHLMVTSEWQSRLAPFTTRNWLESAGHEDVHYYIMPEHLQKNG